MDYTHTHAHTVITNRALTFTAASRFRNGWHAATPTWQFGASVVFLSGALTSHTGCNVSLWNYNSHSLQNICHTVVISQCVSKPFPDQTCQAGHLLLESGHSEPTKTNKQRMELGKMLFWCTSTDRAPLLFNRKAFQSQLYFLWCIFTVYHWRW